MAFFRRLFFVAALAGLAAGVLVTVAQEFGTTSLILEAERYEAGVAAPSDAASDAASTAAHDHEAAAADEWAPADGIERTAYTLLANIVTGIGFALLLVAAYALRGGEMNWRKGLYWGLAGFATFTLAPGLGLSPELPGTRAAELLDRQIWWVATAAATAAGLALIFIGRQALSALAGIVLIALPHIYGAPQPAEFGALAPASLEKQFVVAVVVTSLLFWAVLGSLSGHLYRRFGKATRRDGLPSAAPI
jgi:cobalt transporter subunit CbtA